MKPLVIYTNLYTLKNKEAVNNKYINMFLIWLYHIIKYAKLKEKDHIIALVDIKTYEEIKDLIVLKFLASKTRNLSLIKYNDIPSTHKEGMMKKYHMESIINTTHIKNLDPYYLYLDIDVLVVNDIRLLINKEINNDKPTIYLRNELRSFLDSMYFGELATDEDKNLLIDNNLTKLPGFSAGIFGWTYNKAIKLFFDYIIDCSNKINKDFYTVEQPFFNAAIFNYYIKENKYFNFVVLDSKLIVENLKSFEMSEETVLINFCGEPGNDTNHMYKLLNYMFFDGLK